MRPPKPLSLLPRGLQPADLPRLRQRALQLLAIQKTTDWTPAQSAQWDRLAQLEHQTIILRARQLPRTVVAKLQVRGHA